MESLKGRGLERLCLLLSIFTASLCLPSSFSLLTPLFSISSSFCLPSYKGQQKREKMWKSLSVTGGWGNAAFSLLLEFFPITTLYWNSAIFHLLAYSSSFFSIPSLLLTIKVILEHIKIWGYYFPLLFSPQLFLLCMLKNESQLQKFLCTLSILSGLLAMTKNTTYNGVNINKMCHSTCAEEAWTPHLLPSGNIVYFSWTISSCFFPPQVSFGFRMTYLR